MISRQATHSILLLQPFIDEDQPILHIFPERYYAVAIPVYAGVILFSVTLITLGAFLLTAQLANLKAVLHNSSITDKKKNL